MKKKVKVLLVLTLIGLVNLFFIPISSKITIENIAKASQITHLIKSGVSYPITKSILHLQPYIGWKEANKHANIVYREAERSGIDWKIIVSIVFQETSYLKNRFKGDKYCGFITSNYSLITCVYRTFGVGHIYYKLWKKRLNLDLNKLYYNLNYSYSKMIDLLLIHKSRYLNNTVWPWVGDYNSRNPKIKIKYITRIAKHYNKVNKNLDALLHL